MDKFNKKYFEFVDDYKAITKSDEKPVKLSNGIEIGKRVMIKRGRDSSDIDYGIIIKLNDEFDPSQKTIIIVAGISDEGTAGAAYFLLNRYKELPYDEDTFGVLIVVPGTYQSARIAEFDKVCVKFV